MTHHHQPATYDRAFAFGIALNLGFVAVEAYYGWTAGSLALLADAGHNLSDVAGLILAWVATVMARQAPDHRYTYGRQRASILAAFSNAALLLVAMGSLLWEAVQRLQAPAPTEGLTIIVVAAAGVLVNGLTAALFVTGRESDLNIRGAFLHMAADALVSLGVVTAGGLYLWQGWTWIDPLTSIVIAAVILFSTWGLFRQSLHLLFDGVPESIELAAVDALLRAQPGVSEVHDLHVWAMSSRNIALTAHLVIPGGHPGDDFLAELAAELHRRFDISHPTVQIELTTSEHGCRPPLPR